MHCSKCIFHGGIGVRVTLQAASCSIQLLRWARGPAAAHTMWKHCGHKPAALPEPFATDLLQSECMWNSFTMLLWKVNLFQIYNKTNFKLLSNSAYNEWSDCAPAVLPYQWLVLLRRSACMNFFTLQSLVNLTFLEPHLAASILYHTVQSWYILCIPFVCLC